MLERGRAEDLPSDQPGESEERRRGRVPRLVGLLALPTMLLALAAYVVVHSPLNHGLATLFGLTSKQCYPCGGTPGAGRVVDSLAALLFIAVALLAAASVSSVLAATAAERPLAFGLLGLGFVSAPAATLGAIGSAVHVGLLRPPAGPLICAMPATLALVLGFRSGWRPRRPRRIQFRARGLVLLVGVLSLGLIGASALISLIHPPTQGDALGYHAPLATFLWSDGNLTTYLNRSPDVWALAHPGTAELWYGLLHVAGGAHIADLGQLPSAFLAASAVGVFAWRLGLRTGAALLGAFAFLMGPIVVMQVGMQANDLLAAALLMATMALACAPVASWDRRRLILLGLGLGLTATTKVALLPSVAALALFVFIALIRQLRGEGLRAIAKSVLVIVVLFGVVVAPWWTRDLIRFHNPVYPAALPFVGNGIVLGASQRIDVEFVPRRVLWPLYPVLEPQDDRSGIGALFIVGVLPGFLLALSRARRQPLVVWGTVTVLTLPAWWKYTLHEPRFLIAEFGLAFAFVPWTLALLRGRTRAAGIAVLAAAALFSALVTINQGLLPFAREPIARTAFYDRVWGVDPVASSLPRRDGVLIDTGYGPGSSDFTAYYPMLGDSLSPRHVVQIDQSLRRSTATIVALMRRDRLRFAYMTVNPDRRAAVHALYTDKYFKLLRVSGIKVGKQIAARRWLYRPVSANDPDAIRRYLFRLR